MTQTPPTPPPFRPVSPMIMAAVPPGDGLAMTSLVLGMLSVIPGIGVILGLVAILLGGLALHRKRPGRKRAIAGLTLGILGTLFTFMLIGGGFYSYHAYAVPMQDRDSCRRGNLSALSRGVQMYGADFNGAAPPNLAALAPYTGSLSPVNCPGRSSSRPGRPDYFYFHAPAKLQDVEDPFATIIICDLKGNHKDGRNVAYADGHTAWLTEAEFQDELAEPENAKFAAALKEAEGP